MQMMTWALGRLGSRFGLLFEPSRSRVMHSGLGRFLDQPLDLAVGLVEPDGTERVLPFTSRGSVLHNCELFDRVNSVTFRGFSEKYRLRFELNVHSVFYPQDEQVCLMPAVYLEMRLNPQPRVRWVKPAGRMPEKLKLFIRLQRPDTDITATTDHSGRIDLRYRNTLKPQLKMDAMFRSVNIEERFVDVVERIQCLNGNSTVTPEGDGLMLEMPVSEIGSGTKWRLIWGSYCGDPVLHDTHETDEPVPLKFRYTSIWSDLDEVMTHATRRRDDYLALSRRFEKLLDQLPLDWSKRHLINQSFQSFLTNTWWCDRPDGEGWFSLWEGSCYYHSTLDVEYNIALLYLTLWPKLLEMQLNQWPRFAKDHATSQGRYLSHDVGSGPDIRGQTYPHAMPVEENCNYLLLLQAYVHWSGHLAPARSHIELVASLARYLIWTDRDDSGFPTEGTANTIDDASPATQYAKKQTYLAVKRLAALQAAADMLRRCGKADEARAAEDVVDRDAARIEASAWLGDHYVVCTDRSTAGVVNAWTGQPLPYDDMPGWDAYSIYTGNGLLLPTLTGQPIILDSSRLRADLSNATRETLSPYGCGHSSYEPENVWVSQNLWRDHLAQYLGVHRPSLASRYWDLQVMSNTDTQSYGFIDTYITNSLCFYPRGITSIGYLLAMPRLIIDRLAPGGERITVEPDRAAPARWPLLPLADWKANRIPVCVVDESGQVTIEGEIENIIVHGQPDNSDSTVIG